MLGTRKCLRAKNVARLQFEVVMLFIPEQTFSCPLFISSTEFRGSHGTHGRDMNIIFLPAGV